MSAVEEVHHNDGPCAFVAVGDQKTCDTEAGSSPSLGEDSTSGPEMGSVPLALKIDR